LALVAVDYVMFGSVARGFLHQCRCSGLTTEVTRRSGQRCVVISVAGLA
jgi:hypothetical protein